MRIIKDMINDNIWMEELPDMCYNLIFVTTGSNQMEFSQIFIGIILDSMTYIIFHSI